jgi:hypothetical protein
MGNYNITQDQLNTYKKLTGDDEKYNYYFTNNVEGIDIGIDSIFYKSYMLLKDKLPAEITSKKYNTLVLLVGFSIQPLVLSISVLKPEKVYLLFSGETKPNCSKITNWTNKLFNLIKGTPPKYADIDSWENFDCQYLINSSEPDDTYNKILQIIDKEKTIGNIAIDITGGKKTMVSGAFIAASITSTDSLYVDFDKYDGNNPIPGTELLAKQSSPVEILLKGLKKIFNEISENGKITKDNLVNSIDYKEIYPLLLQYSIFPEKEEILPSDIFHNDFKKS